MNLGFDVGIAPQDPLSVEMETLATDVLTTVTIEEVAPKRLVRVPG